MATRQYAVEFERSTPLQLPPHPKSARTHRFPRWVKEQKKPVAVDLFSGCGGLSAGLEEAGYCVALSADMDPWAIKTHQHNMPGVALRKDLSNPAHVDNVVRMLDGIEVDLVAGGPPCQPFSRAGRSKIRSLVEQGVRSEVDRRAELWRSFLEVVERVRPHAVLMENVPDMALGDDVLVIRFIVRRLEEMGYDAEARLLDAWRYGVPQHRQRLILIAVEAGRPFSWPEETVVTTVRDAIGDLPRLRNGTGEREMPAGRKTLSEFQQRARSKMNGHRVVWDHITRPVRDDDREAFQMLKPGMRYDDLPKRLQRYRSDIFRDKYNRLAWNEVSRSITAHIAKDGYWYIHPGEHRMLSVREAARIQTFPDHFRFAGSRSEAFRQVGNAVPPALGELLGKELLRAARRKPVAAAKRPVRMLQASRLALLRWARADARVAPWRHSGDPWSALVGAVLGDRIGGEDEAVAVFLEQFPRQRRALGDAIKKASKGVGGRERKNYMRLAKSAEVLGTRRSAWDEEGWGKAVRLASWEESLVRMIGLGEPSLIPTKQSLRVVARVTGTNVDTENQQSQGRMLLARFLGLDDESAPVGAALQALGRVICTANDPDCGRCPLKKHCAYSRGR